MLYDNPPIENTPINKRIINALIRNKYAKVDNPHYYIHGDYSGLEINWDLLKEHNAKSESTFLYMRAVGPKSLKILVEWINAVEQNTQQTDVRIVRKNHYSSSHVGGKNNSR